MAKQKFTRKSQMAGVLTPKTAPNPYNGPTFSELEDEILDWINTLQSVSLALDQSEAVGGCDIAAPASNAVRLCAKNLCRLANGLEEAVRHGR